MNTKILHTSCLLLLCTVVMSCASKGYTSSESGFFGGIIHGIVLPFALIGKLFNADCGIYAENNSGFLYWLGFILGVGGLGGGANSARR